MYIGIDLGGTNIAVGIVDKEGKILNSDSRPTLAQRDYTEVVRDMAELCSELMQRSGLSEADIEAIGIGAPGAVNSEEGVIVYANNLKWHNVPLVQELKKYINVPIAVENDGNAAAYGEYCVNGDNKDSFIAVTLGTGVGGGIVINKKVHRGFNGSAGEIGHSVIIYGGELCTCGTKGCWEAYASVTALIRQTKKAIEENPDSLMAEYAKERGKVSGRTSFDAAKAGDLAAQKVVDRYIEYVACGITNLINIFQPEVIVIGGGISKEGDYLLKPLQKYIDKNTYCTDVPQTKIKIATLMNDAGIIGAALSAAAIE